jgi:hypothetical protein
VIKNSYDHVHDSCAVAEIELFESTDLTPLHFCLWGWMKSEVYKRKVCIRDELLARILDAAARIKKRVDQLRGTIHDLRTQVVKCTEFYSWEFRKFIVNCNKSVISVQQICGLNIKIKLTVSNFPFFVTIHNVFVFVDSKNSISVTIQNQIQLRMNFFLTMTDTTPLQNTDLSS